MGKTFRLQRASIDHMREMVEKFSAEDVAELKLIHGDSYKEVLLGCFDAIDNPMVLVNDKTGISYVIGGVQAGKFIWMLTSGVVSKFSQSERNAVYAIMEKHLVNCLKQFPRLVNRVHKNTHSHVRFLERLGAELGEPDADGWIPFEFTLEGIYDV